LGDEVAYAEEYEEWELFEELKARVKAAVDRLP
jgi:hypothetical protein